MALPRCGEGFVSPAAPLKSTETCGLPSVIQKVAHKLPKVPRMRPVPLALPWVAPCAAPARSWGFAALLLVLQGVGQLAASSPHAGTGLAKALGRAEPFGTGSSGPAAPSSRWLSWLTAEPLGLELALPCGAPAFGILWGAPRGCHQPACCWCSAPCRASAPSKPVPRL